MSIEIPPFEDKSSVGRDRWMNKIIVRLFLTLIFSLGGDVEKRRICDTVVFLFWREMSLT
jgi:hypothetical protein